MEDASHALEKVDHRVVRAFSSGTLSATKTPLTVCTYCAITPPYSQHSSNDTTQLLTVRANKFS